MVLFKNRVLIKSHSTPVVHCATRSEGVCGSGSIAPFILNLGTRCAVSFTTGPPISEEAACTQSTGGSVVS